MKNIVVFLFITLSSLTVFGQSKKNEKAIIKTAFYCDHCKECETCGKRFQENLYKIKGLKMFELDDEKMTITVYYNGTKTDLKTIKTAISKLGFDADDMKADIAAYEKLDNCCKKS